jgi:hypothetical protein
MHMFRAGFSSQNGDEAWGVYYWNQRSVLRLLWEKGLNAKYIRKETFSVYGGKCLSRKAVHKSVAKVSLMTKKLKRRCRSVWDNSLLCCGFRCTDKTMVQVYYYWWRICRDIKFLGGFKYYMFYVLYPFVTHLPTLPWTFILSSRMVLTVS